MGNLTTTQKFLEQHPICCFCGGKTPATTRDHVPSRQLFTLKHRPQGMEAPACDFCQDVTRQNEQIAAMLSRSFPDPKTSKEKNEVKNIFQAVANNQPDVLREMEPTSAQEVEMQKSGIQGHALNVRGPLVNHAIGQFGRKLVIAAHYTVTKNIVSRGVGIGVRWFTNYQAMTEGLPPDLDKYLGPAYTLRQGNWSVGDQFFIQWATVDTKEAGMYFAAFRKSFAILGAVHPDKKFLEKFKNGFVFDVFDPAAP